MKYGEDITKDKLQDCLEDLRLIFDYVRVVDPYSVEVLCDDLHTDGEKKVCYKIWNKNHRCSNCISLKAYTNFIRKTKYEFREDEAFFVVAMPFRIVDDNNRTIVVELVNEVSDETFVKVTGQEIVAKTIHEFDNKLYIDSLTGVYNRRYFDEGMFVYETKTSLSKQFGFIIFDLKNFKYINDTYGHHIGDVVLRATADLMNRNTRSEDVVIRLGGDEFMVIMQRCTEEGVQRTMDRIKLKMREVQIPGIKDHVFKINAGYSFTDRFDATKQMINAMSDLADHNMYLDKHADMGSDSAEATEPIRTVV